MEEIKGWTPSFIELVLSLPIGAEETEPPAMDSDLLEIMQFQDAIMEIKEEVEEYIPKKK